ncbi:MAG: S8 family serine peptidase [bacterium]
MLKQLNLSISIFLISISSSLFAGEVLLKFKDFVSKDVQLQIIEQSSATVSGFIEEISVWKLEIPESETADTVISFFERLEEVLYCQENKQRKLFAFTPNDPSYSSQWGLTKAYGINMEDAWDIAGSSGSSSVVIAVIDTGIDYNHEDLKNKMWDGGSAYPNHGYDFADNDNDPEYERTSYPSEDHATHVAGIAAGDLNNGIGIAGVAAKCRIMSVRVLEWSDYWSNYTGSDYDIAAGICWAVTNGAKVINMSLGGPEKNPVEMDACKFAFDNDVFVCASSGNEDSSVGYPAAFTTVFAVGAVDNTFTTSGNKASFSNYGEKLDVVAPGDNILSTVPGDSYDWFDGTSMACPFVAGLAALVLSERPDFGPGDVAEIIRRTASKYPEKDEQVGYGLINASACLAALHQHIANLLVEVTPFPNPFRLGAGINLKFGFKNNPQTLKIFKIFDFTGQGVAELGSSDFFPDNQVAAWDGKNKNGDNVASGVYFYYAETDAGKSKGRFAVIK